MIKEILQSNISDTISALYLLDIPGDGLLVVPTKKEFSGDYTLTVFPIAGKIKKAPPVAAREIGDKLVELQHIASYEVLQGFLNMKLHESRWIETLKNIYENTGFGKGPAQQETILVEFCSPNTNKPLHLGHIRNMLLGDATARILQMAGFEVKRIQVINDRGIAICKSMLAWQKWALGATPESTGIKGDHFVGDYYVLFEKKFGQEYKEWQQTEVGRSEYANRKDQALPLETFYKEFKNQYFNKYSQLGIEARAMLLKWENHDEATLMLWKTMNNWVFDGFQKTYDRLGIRFDHIDYESVTYLLGKEAVKRGLEKNLFFEKPDHSVWVDLTAAGMDQKIVLRSDGTSVYITQDMGTAQMRYDKFKMDRLIYVVADEQDYHFKVLFEIMKRFEEPYADGLYHLSYGMVELPEGKMKSREGNVVDADDLIDEIMTEAQHTAIERGDLTDQTSEERQHNINAIALGAIKFFMLKVHAKKRMVFNPKDSLDLQGQTGPYVQNAYVRIQSILRKSVTLTYEKYKSYTSLRAEEKELISLIETFPDIVAKAADNYEPSELANYSYSLAKSFHRFYHEVPILRAEDESALQFRLVLAQTVGNILRKSFDLLGIDMPDRM